MANNGRGNVYTSLCVCMWGGMCKKERDRQTDTCIHTAFPKESEREFHKEFKNPITSRQNAYLTTLYVYEQCRHKINIVMTESFTR